MSPNPLRYEVKLPLKYTQMKIWRRKENINPRMKSRFTYLRIYQQGSFSPLEILETLNLF
jgi:hypothetical protein